MPALRKDRTVLHPCGMRSGLRRLTTENNAIIIMRPQDMIYSYTRMGMCMQGRDRK